MGDRFQLLGSVRAVRHQHTVEFAHRLDPDLEHPPLFALHQQSLALSVQYQVDTAVRPAATVLGDLPHGEFNMWSRSVLGWLPDEQVKTVTASGVYRVRRFDTQNPSANGALALKIPGANVGDGVHDYWIGLRERPRSGTFEGDFVDKAYVLWGYHQPHQSDLLNMNPSGDVDGRDAGLQIGRTFSENGLTIRALKSGGKERREYLDVEISIASLVRFEAASLTVDQSAGVATLTLNRLGSPDGAVSINYSTMDGNADASMYQPVTGTVIWADKDTTPKTIAIPLIPHGLSAGTASFSVNLTTVSGGVALGAQQATVQIGAAGALDPAYGLNTLTDTSFLNCPLPQADGSLLAFVRSYDSGSEANPSPTGVRYYLVRADKPGRLPPLVVGAMGLDDEPTCCVRLPGERLLVAGRFKHFDGIVRDGLAILRSYGALDSSFAPGATFSGAKALAAQPDEKVLVGGSFSRENGAGVDVIARLNADGSTDRAFQPPRFSEDSSVAAIALQPDGKIVIGGSFSFTNSGGASAVVYGTMRLNADGSRDETFTPALFEQRGGVGEVRALALQFDGSILAGARRLVVKGVAPARRRHRCTGTSRRRESSGCFR